MKDLYKLHENQKIEDYQHRVLQTEEKKILGKENVFLRFHRNKIINTNENISISQ